MPDVPAVVPQPDPGRCHYCHHEPDDPRYDDGQPVACGCACHGEQPVPGETTAEAVAAARKILDMLSKRLARGLPSGTLALPLATSLREMVNASEHIAGVAAARERARIRADLKQLVVDNAAAGNAQVLDALLVAIRELGRDVVLDLLGGDGDQP